MNESEVIMRNAKPKYEFIVHTKALEAAGLAIALARRLPTCFNSLRDQVIRSASSVPANLAEGAGRFGKDRAYHWRIAYGSARETDSHLRLLIEASAVNVHKAHTALKRFDEVRAMIGRLLHPNPEMR